MYGGHAGNGAVDLVSAPHGATDAVLVAAVRAGDDGAFEELYRRYRSRIRAFVYGYVRDEGRSEDVTQEAFLSALRRLRETSSPIAFRPWIYEIARNAAIDLYRRSSRTEEISINVDSALPPADRRHLVGSDAPESAFADKQRLEHLRAALDELSEAHHRILVLRELEGRSYREIGDRMDLTAPAVESTLFRARKRLRKEYSEIDTGRRCASMRSIIAQLAEGVELPRERRKLERHALRCTHCRRRARELGVEPMRQRGFVSRAAALLPLPAILRRRTGDSSWATAAVPAAESSSVLVGKAGALLAAAALATGGGATLGGYGPLAPEVLERQATQPERPANAPRRGPARDVAPKMESMTAPAQPPPAGRLPARPSGNGPLGGGATPNTPPADAPPPDAGGPSLDQGLPGLPPLEQPPLEEAPLEQPPPNAGVSSEVEVPGEVQADESAGEPAGAIDLTAGAAAAELAPA